MKDKPKVNEKGNIELPPEGLADIFTRQDELLVELVKIFKGMEAQELKLNVTPEVFNNMLTELRDIKYLMLVNVTTELGFLFSFFEKMGKGFTIKFRWDAGTISPGNSKSYAYDVPKDRVDIADNIKGWLEQEVVMSWEWHRDGDLIWDSKIDDHLKWNWFTAEARDHCEIVVSNPSGATDNTAYFRGMCAFLDEDYYATFVDADTNLIEDLIIRLMEEYG